MTELFAKQIEGLVNDKSIEHFYTYSGIAEHAHVKFTVESLEKPGKTLEADSSSTRIEDYEFTELTHEKIERNG